MNKKIETLCLFCSTGRTFTFKDIEIVTDNETVLVFTYNAMSDGKSKTMVAYKSQIIGASMLYDEIPF